MVVLVAGIIMVLLALSFSGKDYAWSSPTVLCLIIFGIAIVVMFVFIEWKIPAEPVVPIYFSVVHNSSTISAGLHFLPYIQPISIFSTISGFVVTKTGRYCELLRVGGGITTIGAGLYVLLDDSTSTGKSIDLTLVGGAGMGLLLQPMQQNYTCQAYAPVPTVHISTKLSSMPASCCPSSARP
ncbi:hypothetical protein H4S07_001075 [Coemansia furcata]|uniref:Uncharacterized protein n=1 Tax=Coemansia furcata TaxID=417177 RepID=A0ACC1LNW5_9FUNG|nr:hypothetical protein H4S07_001075 [Coemansia furcata]